jgi:cytochrome c-type biogenesis protein CcmH
MLNLYSLLIGLLFLAALLLALPFMRDRQAFLKAYSLLVLGFFILSFSIYSGSHDHAALSAWMAEDKKHHELLQTFQALGGVDAAIQRVETHLSNDPKDARGFYLLSKLYQSKSDIAHANQALSKAYELAPSNPEIKSSYEMEIQDSKA